MRKGKDFAGKWWRHLSANENRDDRDRIETGTFINLEAQWTKYMLHFCQPNTNTSFVF